MADDPRRFSPVLLLAGIGSLLVSAWALLGGSALLHGLDLRWLLVVVALVVGVLLVVAPGKRRN
jgi:hypothetical protein